MKGTPVASDLTKKVAVRQDYSLIANLQSKETAGRARGQKFLVDRVRTVRPQTGHVRALLPSNQSATQEDAYALDAS